MSGNIAAVVEVNALNLDQYLHVEIHARVDQVSDSNIPVRDINVTIADVVHTLPCKINGLTSFFRVQLTPFIFPNIAFSFGSEMCLNLLKN